jgi:hypothetical protein
MYEFFCRLHPQDAQAEGADQADEAPKNPTGQRTSG